MDIIKEYKPRTTSDRFGEAFAGMGQSIGKSIPQLMQARQEKQQNEKLKEMVSEMTGRDVSGLSSADTQSMLKFGMESELQDKKDKYKALEGLTKNQPKPADMMKAGEHRTNLMGALNTVQDMLDIVDKGNLGSYAGLPASWRGSIMRGETAEDIGSYETAGKALINYVSNIPIRNKAEFETLAGDLIDPDIPDSKKKGSLKQLKKMLEPQYEFWNKTYTDMNGGEEVEQVTEDEFSDSNGETIDMEFMQKIYDASGGDRNKAKQMLIQAGYTIQ